MTEEFKALCNDAVDMLNLLVDAAVTVMTLRALAELPADSPPWRPRFLPDGFETGVSLVLPSEVIRAAAKAELESKRVALSAMREKLALQLVLLCEAAA